MTRLSDRFRRPLAATAALAMTLIAATSGLGTAAVSAQPAASCADAVTSAPTSPATISAASSAYGKILVVGAGDYTGCSLYLLTSDQLRALTGADYACSDNANPTGAPCDSFLWPAVLTDGAPIAGPGVNATLLGTVTRSDIAGLGPVQQVTYAGFPLYRFFLDEEPGETEGANLFDPLTSPTGTWYLVDPSRGHAAPGTARLQLETAPLNGTGPDETVLSVTMNNDFSLFPDVSFPVYTLSTDSGNRSACRGVCAAVYWPPVLTSGRPQAGPGVDQQALGTMVRPDGSHQVTYDGKPLYLFFGDAYIPGLSGSVGIYGAGANSPWGVFDTVPPTP